MKEIIFKFLLRPTAATARFSPETKILVNQLLHASLKKLTSSLYFARRASKERDASKMPILIWLSALFYVKVRAVKEAMRPFEPPSKAVDLTIALSDLYTSTSVQAASSRAREGPQCRGQTQLFGCPCSSPEAVEGRSHLFTEIFVTRRVTPYSFCYDLIKKIKCSSGEAGANPKPFIT